MILQLIFLLMVQFPVFEGIDFKVGMNMSSWTIVDDVVMGGRSDGNMYLNDEGIAVFTGVVSLENNGGFSSIRYRMNRQAVDHASHFVIRLKGDAKKYQFRVKTSGSNWYSYIYDFQTSGEWETIEIPMNEMAPSFRGQKLNYPNFQGETISELGFLVGNKKAEKFTLKLDYISVR